VGANTKYGFCRGCKKWVPRDEMLSINVSVYDAQNNERRIPLRFCPSCHKKKIEETEELRWDNVLKIEVEIKTNKDLAAQSDLEFDPNIDVSEIAAAWSRDAARQIVRPVPKAIPAESARVERPEKKKEGKPKRRKLDPKDDSEAAMRRRGKRVDINY